jgi:hypothetical protein
MEMVDKSAAYFAGRRSNTGCNLPQLIRGHRFNFDQFKVDCRNREEQPVEGLSKKGRGADHTLAAHINDAAGKHEKRLGNAIDSDDP